MDVLLRAALDPLVALQVEVTFQESHLQRARFPFLSHWGEVCGLGTFDCEGFSLTTPCVL